MTPVFVDTSGFYAELDGTDTRHADAKAAFALVLDRRARLVTTNYIIHESWAVIQVRLGWDAVDAWLDRVVPKCEIVWISHDIHDLGAARCRQARQRRLSLSDCVSIEVMRRRRINLAIAFDEHFDREGFRLPAAGDFETEDSAEEGRR
jgi:predicted nucleic acid-binding protein